jgi:uncharacterized repeat protein (TIGR03803 family)
MKYNISFRAAAVAAVSFGVVFATIACGGSGGGFGSASQQPSPDASGAPSPQAAGALTVAVRWPQRAATTPGAHMIPDDANSILMLLVQNGATIASACLARPVGTSGATTSSYTFTDVPTGQLTVSLSAYPADGCSQGLPPQATGSAAVTMQPGVNQTVSIGLVGTVASVAVIPSTATAYLADSPVTLTASALDSQGNTVMTAPGDWTWSCSPSAVVSPASGTGAQAVLTGAQVGQAACAFTLLQAAGATPVTGSATVTVQPAPTPTPAPTPAATPIPQYTLTVMASFDGSDGARPAAGLVTDGLGNFFGTTSAGGDSNDGTIFEWNANTGITALASLGDTDGDGSFGSLVADGQGDFYGTIFPGDGSNDGGAIFEWNATSGLKRLATFDTVNASGPLAGLLSDGEGNYYGTTQGGGANTGGTIYKWNTQSGITVLASFAGGNGQIPQCALVGDGQGNLYGTTVNGGSGNDGTIFEWNATSGITTLHSFSGADGAGPRAGLVSDGEGNFYGVAQKGGSSNDGTLFEWSPSGGLQTLAAFNGANGAEPLGALITDGKGDFYGTTYRGGTNNGGTVFQWNANSGLTTLANFTNAASNPYDNLVSDGQGNFYGTTVVGGNDGDGTIFELSPVGESGAVRRGAAAVSAHARQTRA